MMVRKPVIIGGVVAALLLGAGTAFALALAYAGAAARQGSVVDNPAQSAIPGASSRAGDYVNITPFELQRRILDPSDNRFVILDVRDEGSYDTGHIPGAINIPLKELGYRMFALDKTRDIIVYCRSGLRSKVACQVLISGGFKDVYNLVGGMKEWDYPVETSDGRVSI